MGTNIDYINTNNETLKLISGRPNYPLLKKVKDEMMASASSVTCNLGGRANGHLGLLLSPLEYANIRETENVERTLEK